MQDKPMRPHGCCCCCLHNPHVIARRIKQQLLELLGTDGILALPSAPGPAFLNGALDAEAFQQLRLASLSLTSIASLAGLPQVCGWDAGGRRDGTWGGE
jgi:Asp-tRNA(Asn)/Glu-tRNA(Gln) amidotransferase A subunit family amidase